MSQMNTFVDEYLGKIFYFCLKRTGNEQDAAELASDISYEIIKAFHNGQKPLNLNAWIWTISRNRWSKWATKHFYQENSVDLDEYDEELVSDQNVEEVILKTEDQEYIHRELAFIRSDYRQILVAHYFDEMSVSEISQNFKIPLGTVKTKLQNSRKILKEGMEMARKFGTRSYKPETIYFSASGNQPSELPHSAVIRKIPVNILCEANNNPCTIEELSMQLGIAVPYMEEEVAILEQSELLRKVDKQRYLTSFFISPKECQDEVYEIACEYVEKMYKDIWNIAGEIAAKVDTLHVCISEIPMVDVQMFFALRIEQCLEVSNLPEGIFRKFKRKDGGDWGFFGCEAGAHCRLPLVGISNNGNYWEDMRWDGYQTSNEKFGKQLYKLDTPSGGYISLSVLRKIARQIPIDTFNDSEKEELRRLDRLGFCRKTKQGDYKVVALLFAEDTEQKLSEYLKTHDEYQTLHEEMKAYLEEVRMIIAKYSVEALKEDFDYYVAMSSPIRHIFAGLWKEKNLYTGDSAQFCAMWK